HGPAPDPTGGTVAPAPRSTSPGAAFVYRRTIRLSFLRLKQNRSCLEEKCWKQRTRSPNIITQGRVCVLRTSYLRFRCKSAILSIAVVVVALLAAMPALASDPIKIGVLVSQSPPGSVIQGTEVTRGLEIMKDYINANGGVLGRPLQLLYEDSAGLPERGRSGAEKLITADNVVALTGGH